MKNTIKYNEIMEGAVEAMMQSALTDEFVDKKIHTNFPKTKRKEVLTLKDVRAMNLKRKKYKESTELAVNAMMQSAINDEYADKNKPSMY